MIQRLLLSEKDMQKSLPHPLLMQLSESLALTMGLYYPSQRWSDLERGIAMAAAASGTGTAEAYARQILSAPLGRSQIETLATYLTVGETYFFREQESLNALAVNVLPELMSTCAREGRAVRIWSAGCCTGEEPYSVAMLLDQMVPHYEEWNVSILATDINPAFLKHAARGVYNEWSFRHTPAWVRERYFKEKKHGCFELLPRIRKRVTFSYLNLAEDVYPAAIPHTPSMDIIFCRNVMMYFSPEGRARVAQDFHGSLIDGGWLIVGSAEMSGGLNNLFLPVNVPSFPGAALYRKTAYEPAKERRVKNNASSNRSDCIANPGAVPDWAVPVPDSQSSRVPNGREASSQISPNASISDPSAESAESRSFNALYAAARSYASHGQLDLASRWCEQAITASRLNPAAHYLLATIQLELGQAKDAVQSLQRALYLDPDFVLAHFLLGSVHLTHGRSEEADRCFNTALFLLSNCTPEEVLPESEGLAAAHLARAMEFVRTARRLGQ